MMSWFALEYLAYAQARCRQLLRTEEGLPGRNIQPGTSTAMTIALSVVEKAVGGRWLIFNRAIRPIYGPIILSSAEV